MVRLPLGRAYRCGRGRAGPVHQPQRLEGVMVQALLREEALRRVEQEQVLMREEEGGGGQQMSPPNTHTHTPHIKTSQTSWNIQSCLFMSHLHYHESQAAAAHNCVLQSPNRQNIDIKHDL